MGWDFFRRLLQSKSIQKIVLLSCLVFLGIPDSACGRQPSPDPVVILYHDATGSIDLNDISTQPQPKRIIFHMLNVVFPQEFGIKVKLKPIMWTRGLELIKSGLADGIINASYNEERAAYAVYPTKAAKPDPAKMLQSAEYFLYKHKKSTITWDGVKFAGIDGDIVSIQSFAIVKDLRKKGITVREELNTPWVIRNLAIGKFKSAALQNYAVNEFLEDNPALQENIIKIEPPLKRKEYYLVFSKKFYKEHTELAESIWNAIEDYKSSDDYLRMKKEIEK